jgi:hypothetical protein
MGKPACHDLRLGIVDGASEHPVPAILYRDDIAVFGVAENLQDLGPVDPVMTVENTRPRAYDETCHKL